MTIMRSNPKTLRAKLLLVLLVLLAILPATVAHFFDKVQRYRQAYRAEIAHLDQVARVVASHEETLVHNAGHLRPEDPVGAGSRIPGIRELLGQAGRRGAMAELTGIDGVERLVALAPVRGPDGNAAFYVMLGSARHALVGEFMHSVLVDLAVFGTVILLSLFGAWRLGVNPLASQARAAPRGRSTVNRPCRATTRSCCQAGHGAIRLHWARS